MGNGCLKKDCSFSGKTPKAISFGKVQQTSPKNIWDFEDSGRYDIQVCLNMGKQNQTYNELSVFPSHQSDRARFWAQTHDQSVPKVGHDLDSFRHLRKTPKKNYLGMKRMTLCQTGGSSVYIPFFLCVVDKFLGLKTCWLIIFQK